MQGLWKAALLKPRGDLQARPLDFCAHDCNLTNAMATYRFEAVSKSTLMDASPTAATAKRCRASPPVGVLISDAATPVAFAPNYCQQWALIHVASIRLSLMFQAAQIGRCSNGHLASMSPTLGSTLAACDGSASWWTQCARAAPVSSPRCRQC